MKKSDFIKFLIKNQMKLLSILALFLIVLWWFIFHKIEWRTFLDSIYFIVQTVSTVWYWDFVPTHEITKIITIFYSLSIVPLIFYLWTKTIDNSLKEKIKKLENENSNNWR